MDLLGESTLVSSNIDVPSTLSVKDSSKKILCTNDGSQRFANDKMGVEKTQNYLFFSTQKRTCSDWGKKGILCKNKQMIWKWLFLRLRLLLSLPNNGSNFLFTKTMDWVGWWCVGCWLLSIWLVCVIVASLWLYINPFFIQRRMQFVESKTSHRVGCSLLVWLCHCYCFYEIA